MSAKPFGDYCHKHGKGMFRHCQDCFDKLVALGIQADKERIAELERELPPQHQAPMHEALKRAFYAGSNYESKQRPK